jgi:iron complex outermembrane receptor protein
VSHHVIDSAGMAAMFVAYARRREEEAAMVEHTSIRRSLAGASVIASALIAAAFQPAQAQTAESDGADRSEEIIVTARRQEEPLQDVPAAVSAFGAQALFENQIETIGDLQSHVPNLSLHVGDASNAVVYVRGIGQIDSISFNDPGVGVYLDDVYLGRVQGSFLEVVDPQQIEVLRGPQGTLYGRNTIGGALRFTSAMPSDHLEGYVEGAAGNYNERRVRARISGPLTTDEVLRGALAVASSVRDGYTENLADGHDDGDKDLFAWRGSLLFQPNDTFSAYLTVDGSRNRPDRSRTPHRETPIFSPSLGDFRPVIEDPYIVDVTYNDLERLDTSGVSLTLTQEFGDFTIKSITAYRDMDYRTHLDLDSSPDETFGIYDFEEQDQTSQEFQLLYNGDRLSLVAGLFYFRENDWTFGGAVAPDYAFLSGGLRLSENESIAGYTQADWRLTERASVTLGLRYTHERKWTDNRGEFFTDATAPTAEDMERLFGTGVGFGETGFTAEETWNSLTPRLAFNYAISDDTLFYISAAQGFKSGGFNGRVTTAPQAFEPETLWSYEAGLKFQTRDRRFRINTAVFFQDYEDMQVSRFSADPDTGDFVAVFDNAGGAEMYGLEAELEARLTDALTLNGNLGYLHSEYTEFVDAGVDVSDRALVNAPEWSARLGATYDVGLGEAGDLRLLAGVSFRSKTYLTVSASEVLAQDDLALFDASLIYTPPSDHWSIVLSGQNLSDEAYLEHGFDLSAFPGVQLGYVGAPRTYSLSVRYRF